MYSTISLLLLLGRLGNGGAPGAAMSEFGARRVLGFQIMHDRASSRLGVWKLLSQGSSANVYLSRSLSSSCSTKEETENPWSTEGAVAKKHFASVRNRQAK